MSERLYWFPNRSKTFSNMPSLERLYVKVLEVCELMLLPMMDMDRIKKRNILSLEELNFFFIIIKILILFTMEFADLKNKDLSTVTNLTAMCKPNKYGKPYLF